MSVDRRQRPLAGPTRRAADHVPVCLSLQWGPFEEGVDRSGRLVRVTEKGVAFLAERANAPTAHERIQIRTQGVTWPRGVRVVHVSQVCDTYDLIAAEYFHPPGGAS